MRLGHHHKSIFVEFEATAPVTWKVEVGGNPYREGYKSEKEAIEAADDFFAQHPYFDVIVRPTDGHRNGIACYVISIKELLDTWVSTNQWGLPPRPQDCRRMAHA